MLRGIINECRLSILLPECPYIELTPSLLNSYRWCSRVCSAQSAIKILCTNQSEL